MEESDKAQFRSVDEVRSDFTGTGWTVVSHDEVTWLRSANLAEDFERLKLRAVSVFEHMSEEVVEAGFARIEAALPSLGDGLNTRPASCSSSSASHTGPSMLATPDAVS
jgi:hypothetical protein